MFCKGRANSYKGPVPRILGGPGGKSLPPTGKKSPERAETAGLLPFLGWQRKETLLDGADPA